MPIHLIFDLIASVCAFGVTVAVYRWRLEATSPVIEKVRSGYAIALVLGAAIGGYGFGTLNLWLSGIHEIGRSIVGALAGAIAAVEFYKWRAAVRGSTGIVFVAGLATSIAIGRWGCFFSGLDDMTHGTPTSLPWGRDFGDGITRHPVQIYESLAMTAFLVVAFRLLQQRNAYFMRNGFYVFVGVYALQRFAWEFLKPYAPLAASFNLFHFVCIGLFAYAAGMIWQNVNQPRLSP